MTQMSKLKHETGDASTLISTVSSHLGYGALDK